MAKRIVNGKNFIIKVSFITVIFGIITLLVTLLMDVPISIINMILYIYLTFYLGVLGGFFIINYIKS